MIKFSEIVGLPVINIATGEKIGSISDVVINVSNKEIFGVLLNFNKKLLTTHMFIEEKDIIKVGASVVLINNEDCIKPLNELPKNGYIKKYSGKVSKNQVYTDSGVNLGTIQDAMFNFEIGKLEGIEISDGIIQDLIYGKKIITAMQSVHLEQGTIIIEAIKTNMLKSDGKGIKKFLRREE